ncbi:MAG: hypothetical protein ACRDKZ_02130, partial [Actinomycetota bacterium]
MSPQLDRLPAASARLASLDGCRPFTASGSVARVVGHELEIRGLRARVGDVVTIDADSGPRIGEIVSVAEEGARALILGETAGLGRGDRVTLSTEGFTVQVSPELVGRVIDGTGQPMDGRPLPAGLRVRVDDEDAVPAPLARKRIEAPLPVGVRLIDGLCTTGRGQRVGIFGGSGVGKSTLLGMLARGTTADVVVIALIGERGREV